MNLKFLLCILLLFKINFAIANDTSLLNCTNFPIVIEDFTINSVIAVKERYFMVDSLGRMLSTIDGTSWDITVIENGAMLKGIAWNGEVFLVSTLYGNIYRSFDSIVWELVKSDNSSTVTDIHTNGETFVVIGSRGQLLISNKNGEDWNKVKLDSTWITGATWDSEKYILISKNKFESKNGYKWNKIKNDQEIPRGRLTFGNGQYIIAALKQTIYYGKDILNLKKVILDTKISYFRFAGSLNNMFFLTSDCGWMFTSVDGKNWNTTHLKDNNNIRSIATNGKSYLAVGSPGKMSNKHSTILLSKNGVIWKDISVSVPRRKKENIGTY